MCSVGPVTRRSDLPSVGVCESESETGVIPRRVWVGLRLYACVASLRRRGICLLSRLLTQTKENSYKTFLGPRTHTVSSPTRPPKVVATHVTVHTPDRSERPRGRRTSTLVNRGQYASPTQPKTLHPADHRIRPHLARTSQYESSARMLGVRDIVGFCMQTQSPGPGRSSDQEGGFRKQVTVGSSLGSSQTA